MKSIYITLLLFCLNTALIAQASSQLTKPNWHFFSKTLTPDAVEDMPEWVKPLYSNAVNISEVERAMTNYYRANGGFKRDTYSRFFQRWLQAATPYIEEDGIVRNWSTTKILEQQQAKTLVSKPTKSASNWTHFGPEETFWRAGDGTGPANWQANVYSFDIAPSDNNILYAGTETSGLFKTTDKGLNWTFVGQAYNFSGGITAVSIHPTNTNIVLAAASSHIFRSTDGGINWTIVYTQSGLACSDIAFHPSIPTRILASTEQGLFRSNDGGTTWTMILSENFYDVEWQPSNPNQVYALGHNTGSDTFVFYKSTDGGINFSPSMSGWGTIYERSGGKLAVSAANSNYIYAILLTDNGAGSDEKPYLQKSTDGGATWTSVAIGLTSSFPLNNGQGYFDLALVVSQTNANHVVAGTQTMYRSTDGGATFSCLSGYCSEVLQLHPDMQAAKCAGGDCWIATDGGMNYSTDFFASTANHQVRNNGIASTHFWGYTQGWNQDMYVGGRYHNGNTAWHENYPAGQSLRMGGAESATGWILYGREPKAYFDDIGPYTIPLAITDVPVQDFAFTKHPNKVYGATTSRLLTHPENAAIHFTGEGNDFWKSVDGGITWTSLQNFGEQVWWFEISRSNPDVLYVFTQNGFHKTTDGGATWSNITTALPSGFGYYSRGRVTISGTNENTLWVLRYNGGNGAKVYKSTDGGTTWSNWTTATLDGRNFSCLVHVLGTDGGVYLASLRGSAGTNEAKVYYRKNTDSDWTDCSVDLPGGLEALKLVPFYRDSKIRLAGTLSAWEMDLIEPFNIISQPMIAHEDELKCGENIQFDCYSILDHSGATWSWSFPGASSVSSNSVRNPVVSYSSPGTYTATLTITRGVEMSSKTIDVIVGTGNICVRGIAIAADSDTDNDGLNDFLESTICTNDIPASSAVSGTNVLVKQFDFNGSTTGVFYVDLSVYTPCYGSTARLQAFVDLDFQTLQVLEYDHFVAAPNDILGDGTNTLTSQSTAYAQVRFQLNGSILDVIQVSNACGSSLQLEPSCWSNLDADGDGQMNLEDTDSDADGIDDTTETTACDNSIAPSAWVSGTNILVGTLDFGGASSGIFYVSLNAFTNCYNTTATLNAYVDLDAQTIQVVSYSHFAAASDVYTGNNTNTITPSSASYAQISFQLIGNQLQVIQIANACGSVAVMRLNTSCWSALDTNTDGVNEFLDIAPVTIEAKLFLQGPYNSGTGEMTTAINSILPLAQPYTNIYAGTESLTSIPTDVVDWVLVELRQPANTVVSRRAGLLKKDGTVVDLDASSPLSFNVVAGNYFVSVRHRNHLGVMTQNAVLLN